MYASYLMNFGPSLYLRSYLVCASNEGSEVILCMHRFCEPSLLAYAITTVTEIS